MLYYEVLAHVNRIINRPVYKLQGIQQRVCNDLQGGDKCLDSRRQPDSAIAYLLLGICSTHVISVLFPKLVCSLCFIGA